MGLIKLQAAAKINPFLQIVAERPDGYHDLAMILHSIGLWDTIDLETSNSLELYCNLPELPTDRSNLAIKAALLLQENFPDRGGVKITLNKQIPVGAGLAGGSADCAAVLVGLNQLWELNLSPMELQTYGAKLGSDIPFCVVGGACLAEGRGEILTPLQPLEGWTILVCKQRNLSISTAWAYQTFRSGRLIEQPTGQTISNILGAFNSPPSQLAPLLFNDLERVVLPNYPAIDQLKLALLEFGAIASLMSGSGAAVFAVVENTDRGDEIAGKITDRFPDVDTWVTKPIGWGVRIVS